MKIEIHSTNGIDGGKKSKDVFFFYTIWCCFENPFLSPLPINVCVCVCGQFCCAFTIQMRKTHFTYSKAFRRNYSSWKEKKKKIILLRRGIKLSFLGQRMLLYMWHFLFNRLDNVVHGKHDHIMFLFAHQHRHPFILMPQLTCERV